MNTLAMAARNLRRNRRRTLITTVSVAFGIGLAVIFVGTRKSTYERLVDAGTKAGLGHATMAPEEFLKTPSVVRRLGPDLVGKVVSDAAVPGLAAAWPRIVGNAVVTTSAKNTGAVLIGIDPARETGEFNAFLAALKDGKALAAGDESGALVGSKMAQRLGLSLDSKIVYTTADGTGQVISQLAYVRGLFTTGSHELDGHTVLLPLSHLAQQLGYQPGEASVVALFTRHAEGADALAHEVLRRYGRKGVEVAHWHDTLPDLAQYIRIDEAMYRVLLGFIAVIIAAGILNTMTLSVLERRRELGIMLVLGMTPWSIMGLVASEAVMIFGLGLALGTLVVAPLYAYLHYVGLDLSRLLGDRLDAGGVAVDFVVGCRLNWVDGMTIAGTLAVLTLLAAAYPAAKAAWIPPMATIRKP